MADPTMLYFREMWKIGPFGLEKQLKIIPNLISHFSRCLGDNNAENSVSTLRCLSQKALEEDSVSSWGRNHSCEGLERMQMLPVLILRILLSLS